MSGETLAISDLSSPLPDGMLGARERVDPYWDGLWSQGSNAAWLSHRDVAAQGDAGLVKVPSWAKGDPGAALELLQSDYMRSRRLGMLASINEFRTLTVEQLACLQGYSPFVEQKNRLVAEAFCAQVVDVGTFASPLSTLTKAQRVRLVRPSRTNVFVERVSPSLTYPEYAGVTGGVEWLTAGQFDRHNILATELLLRAGELCETGVVLGELHSSVGLLTALDSDTSTKDYLGKAADGCVVRSDGARIAIELTASVSADFDAKVTRWAQVLSESPWDLSGLMVVFVVAPPPGRVRSVTSSQLVTKVRDAVVRAVKRHPGTARDMVMERMSVVAWDEWFPASGMIDTAFLDMTAWRPTGEGGDEGRWEPVGLLNVVDVPFEPDDFLNPLAVLDAAPWLWGIPHWQRGADSSVHLWTIPVSQFTEVVPVPAPRRKDRSRMVLFALPRGIAGRPKPPARMKCPIP